MPQNAASDQGSTLFATYPSILEAPVGNEIVRIIGQDW